MLQHFLISRKKEGMEDRVNLPLRGNAKVEGSAGDNFLNFKGASSFHLEFLGPIHVKVGHLKPDFISHLPRGEFGGYPFFHLLLNIIVDSR